MKSKINMNTEGKLPYPKLMKSLDDNQLIVLFTEERKGAVVNPDTRGDYEIGEIGVNWCGPEMWEDFNGEVTLSND